MLVYEAIEAYPSSSSKPLVLGLGNFDGVHKGHQALIHYLITEARRIGGVAAVFTFSDHPQHVLHPQNCAPLLSSSEGKLLAFEKMGVDLCFLLPFTEKFSKIEPEDFVHNILVKRLGVYEVCLGRNARFGYQRKGDVRLMRRYAESAGFRFYEMPPVEAAGAIVSSSRIRSLISSGNLEEAEQCLGHPYRLLRTVVHGSGRGKILGYPTANLEEGPELMPPEGVYPVMVEEVFLHKKKTAREGVAYHFKSSRSVPAMRGVMNYGQRPTFGNVGKKPIAEIFLLDESVELYGRRIEVSVYPRLREERQFDNPGTLQEQISRDVAHVRAFFQQRIKCSEQGDRKIAPS